MGKGAAFVQSGLYKLSLRSWCIMRELQRHNIPVVRSSVPVLYFGNLEQYLSSPLRVITAALNPSKNEFPDEEPAKRFPGACGAYPKGYFAALNQYFDPGHEPLWEWFVHFDTLLEGLRSGFRAGRPSRAVHTDLCSPIATQPTYSGLTSPQRRELEQLGAPLWSELAELIDPDVIVMSGGVSMRDRVAVFVDARWQRIFGSGRKSVELAEVDAWGRRRVGVFGLTTNVPFGALSFGERRLVGALVVEAVRSINTGRVRATNGHSRRIRSTPEERRMPIKVPEAPPPANMDFIKAAREGEPVSASYNFSRLCFRRNVIESIGPSEMFRVITPIGTFQMTKIDFYRDFGNVVESKSYREDGIYHYPKPPARAERYRVCEV
jgi:hypothetical protein